MIEFLREKGQGTPVVFLHGWLGSKDFWNYLDPDFKNSKIFCEQRCSSSSVEEFDMETLVEGLEELLEELGIEKPILVGHSMGGMVALKYSTRNPVSGLFLLATSASTPEPENKSVKYFLENFGELSRAEWAEEIVNNYVGSGSKKMREMTRKELMKANEEPIIHGLEVMKDYDVREEIDEVPAVVVAGKRDGAITMEKSREVAELLDCELKKIDTTHQMLPEEPEKISEMIEDFIRNIS
jgi:pimeloyl-ACP methyl ester carboxylesterase